MSPVTASATSEPAARLRGTNSASSRRPAGPALARVGFLAFAATMAIAIIGVSWSNYRNVLGAAVSLNRSQALVFRIALERELRRGNSLRELIDDHAGDGLNYVAAYNEQGLLFDQAGTPATPPPDAVSLGLPGDFREARLEELDDRVRSIARSGLPRRQGRFAPIGGQSGSAGSGVRPGIDDAKSLPGTSSAAGPSLSFAQGPRRERPAALLVEFTPAASIRLKAEALRTFSLSVITAPVLLGAGGFVWYLLRRREEYLLLLERQERLSALGEMAAVLAHEIRNPLASLKGHAQLLSERFEAAAAERHKADRIVTEATRLERLTTNLLDFARAGSLRRTPSHPLGPLNAAIDTVGVGRIDVEAAKAPAEWLLDTDAVQQMLANVLQNALQAAPGDQAVHVSVGVEHGALVYRVRDRGPGIPPGLESRIFEPFVTTRTRGVGLGLAIAQRIARLHGGSIDVSTHPEGGALFRITIPAS